MTNRELVNYLQRRALSNYMAKQAAPKIPEGVANALKSESKGTLKRIGGFLDRVGWGRSRAGVGFKNTMRGKTNDELAAYYKELADAATPEGRAAVTAKHLGSSVASDEELQRMSKAVAEYGGKDALTPEQARQIADNIELDLTHGRNWNDITNRSVKMLGGVGAGVGGSYMFGGSGSYDDEDPAASGGKSLLTPTLAGAGIGGLLGATAYALTPEDADRQKKKSLLKYLLPSIAIGAGAGAGYGYLS